MSQIELLDFPLLAGAPDMICRVSGILYNSVTMLESCFPDQLTAEDRLLLILVTI